MKVIEPKQVQIAADALQSGKVVAFPTETVYGLGALIQQPAAISEVFRLKKRPLFDPLIVHVHSISQAKTLTQNWPPLVDFLARSFWPGPLTIVLPKTELVSDMITAGLDSVGIRMPAHPWALALIEKSGSPIAAPSANRFGHVSPTEAAHVLAEFPGAELFILDAGPSDIGIESTVIEVIETDGREVVHILRPGGVTLHDLQTALQRWGRSVEILGMTSTKSPGHLENHYQPDKNLVLMEAGQTRLSAEQLSTLSDLLGYKKPEIHYLNLHSEPTLAARELYKKLRLGSETSAQALAVSAFELSQNGIEAAINNRLERAAHFLIQSGKLVRKKSPA